MWGKIRHDFVALGAMLVLVVLGVIQPENAFTGFAHPAVITVAAVLILGQSLVHSGLIEVVGNRLLKISNNLILQIFILCGMVAFASTFINNVGALAIMMPIVLHLAHKSGNSPSKILMPVAFASLLGGMITLIGTPPNIIIASFRGDETGQDFSMFDFAPVGIILTIIGILYIGFFGWRLLPKRTSSKNKEDLFDIDKYVTEVQITPESKLLGLNIEKLENETNAHFQLIGLVRNEDRIYDPEPQDTLKQGDIIIIQTDTDELKKFISDTNSKLVGSKKFRKDAVGSDKISFAEAVVMPESQLLNKTASSLKIRTRFRVNILAIARKEQQIRNRIDHTTFKVGDVLLVQGKEGALSDTITSMGCLPLAKRDLQLKYKQKIILSLSIFAISIILIMTNFLPVEISFMIAALGMVAAGVMPVKEVYKSINWPVIVLLGAMIPVGTSMETSGGADIIADFVLNLGNQFPPWVILGIIITITMLLSAVINNAATVVLMAPIATSVAYGLGVSADPFLMAVAVGGSSAFLTPIGHQSNTLVMGPGGYQFSDYVRMGIPMTLIILIFGVVSILFFWPL